MNPMKVKVKEIVKAGDCKIKIETEQFKVEVKLKQAKKGKVEIDVNDLTDSLKNIKLKKNSLYGDKGTAESIKNTMQSITFIRSNLVK